MKDICLWPKPHPRNIQALDVVEDHATSKLVSEEFQATFIAMTKGLIVEHVNYKGLRQLQKLKNYSCDWT